MKKKKILLLHTSKEFKNSPLYFAAAEKESVELVTANYKDILVDYRNTTVEILVKGEPLANFTIVFFRAVGSNQELVSLVVDYCLRRDIVIYDKVFRNIGSWIDRKSYEYSRFIENKLPVVPSLFLSSENLNLIESWPKPLIVKETDQARGDGVHLAYSISEIEKIYQTTNKKHLLFQPFIQNDYDIRVLVLGDQVLGAIKRIRTKENEYRNNVSQGGVTQVHELSHTESQLALAATKALDYTLAGVDILVDKESRAPYILEVNISPQFNGFMDSTGIDVPAKIIAYLVQDADTNSTK